VARVVALVVKETISTALAVARVVALVVKETISTALAVARVAVWEAKVTSIAPVAKAAKVVALVAKATTAMALVAAVVASAAEAAVASVVKGVTATAASHNKLIPMAPATPAAVSVKMILTALPATLVVAAPAVVTSMAWAVVELIFKARAVLVEVAVIPTVPEVAVATTATALEAAVVATPLWASFNKRLASFLAVTTCNKRVLRREMMLAMTTIAATTSCRKMLHGVSATWCGAVERDENKMRLMLTTTNMKQYSQRLKRSKCRYYIS